MRSHGHTLIELLVVLAILAVLATAGIPTLRAYGEAARLDGASDVFKGEFRKARSMAIASNEQTAIVFEGEHDGASFAVYRDGNDNGVRRSDIASGRDVLVSGPFPLTGEVSGVHVAIHPGTPAIPPAQGTLDPHNPIAFGRSNILSFSPLSTATPGTFYLAGRRLQAAVRVTGGSSRVRVMICDGGTWYER